MQETLRLERDAHRKQASSTLQTAQMRISDMDMAYFRVEAELKMKTAEAKKYWGRVKQLEEEASAQDRLRRKAELVCETEMQKRQAAEKSLSDVRGDVEAMEVVLGEERAAAAAVWRDREVMKLSQEAAVEDMAGLLDKNSADKEVITQLRGEVARTNDLDYSLSVARKREGRLLEQVAALELEVAGLLPLRGEVAALGEETRALRHQAQQLEASSQAVSDREGACRALEAQFLELSETNQLLLGESSELEGQLETLSGAFEQRGVLLRELERRLDVSTSDAAYLRCDNARAREQVRLLGEKVQTLMANYNEASAQNEEKGFAVRGIG